MKTRVKSLWAVLCSGALFGAGLALSTMIQPEVVLSFLRFVDFGLLLVLGGAVVVTALAVVGIRRTGQSSRTTSTAMMIESGFLSSSQLCPCAGSPP